MTDPKLAVEGQTIAAPAQPEVAGTFNRPLWEFERDCRVLLGEEQRKPNPDNAIIAALCDSVRLVRDYAAVLFQEKLAAVVDRAGTERSAPAAPHLEAMQEYHRRLLDEDIADALDYFFRWKRTSDVALDAETVSAMDDLLASWKQCRSPLRDSSASPSQPTWKGFSPRKLSEAGIIPKRDDFWVRDRVTNECRRMTDAEWESDFKGYNDPTASQQEQEK